MALRSRYARAASAASRPLGVKGFSRKPRGLAAAALARAAASKFADMKNTGGSRWGGAITAAQFIKRFVDDKVPWAHLDIAGTGFDSRQTDINKSWGSGWGVRLLNRLVEDYYER